MKCDIIIPVWNHLEHTKNCIEHIARNTRYPYRLIIIDNASSDGTGRYLEDLKKNNAFDMQIITNGENAGFVRAVNQGLRSSDSPYVCIMNNDTTPAPGWLENMIEFAESHKDAGFMNPQCARAPGSTLEEHAKKLAENNRGKYMEMNQCFGFCLLAKREVIDKIGYMDESFGMGCYDDTDYSMRAHKAGYRCVSVHSAYVHHIHSVSFRTLGNRRLLEKEGERQYLKKWPRHLRAGVALSINGLTEDDDVKNILKAVLFLAREWCWVNFWIFGDVEENKRRINDLSGAIGMPLHQNIKFNYMEGSFKGLNLLVRLLERAFGTRRRKRYDMVFLDDEKSAAFLKLFRFIHGTLIRSINIAEDPVPGIREDLSRIRGMERVS